jgi:hypothetical protein
MMDQVLCSCDHQRIDTKSFHWLWKMKQGQENRNGWQFDERGVALCSRVRPIPPKPSAGSLKTSKIFAKPRAESHEEVESWFGISNNRIQQRPQRRLRPSTFERRRVVLA